MQDMPMPAYVFVQKHLSPVLYDLPLASIIKFPPAGEPKDLTYAELACNEADAKLIRELIGFLGENGYIACALNSSELERWGAQIAHVHPLKFLATIFKDPRLRLCVRNVSEESIKWSRFLKGLKPNLTREADKGKLEQYLTSFAADIGVPADLIYKYFQNRDWEGLVHRLINAYD